MLKRSHFTPLLFERLRELLDDRLMLRLRFRKSTL